MGGGGQGSTRATRARLTKAAPGSLRVRGHERTQTRVVAEIAEAIGNRSHYCGRLLEIDAGSGTQTLVFRDRLRRPETPWIYGREDSRAPVVVAETEFARVDFELQRFPARDGAFDVVVWRGDLVTVKDIVRPLGEVQRVLRPGGAFLLSVPNLAALHNRVLLLIGRQPTTLHIAEGDHVRAFALRSMTGFLRASGWHVVRTAGVGLHPFTSRVMPRPLRDLSHTALWVLEKGSSGPFGASPATSGHARHRRWP
jgi:SAM-dependent methyltransferase